MICPFSKITGQVGSACKENCALWRITSPKTPFGANGECVFQSIATQTGFFVDALQLIIDPSQVVKDPFVEEDDDRIMMCRWCGRVQNPDGKWEMPQRIPKDPENTTRHQICPVCFEKEQRDVFSPESPLDDPVQEIDPEEVRHNDGE